MPRSLTKPVYRHWHITVDRATERTIAKIQKNLLGGGSRSAAIRYLARSYANATSQRSGQDMAT